MRISTVLLAMTLVLGLRVAVAADGGEVVWATFEDEGELKHWSGGDSGQVKMTIDHRDVTDRNKSLRVETLGGQYPGISTYKMPKDWSKHEVFSFEVWSSSKYGLGIRIDEAKSVNFKTRHNGSATLEKGRNLIQIPVKELSKTIDVSQIKAVILFTVDSPKGFTLYFDNFRLGPPLTDKVEFMPYDQRIELVPTTNVESAHFPLCKPTVGGPLKVLSVYGMEEGRDLTELMQRIDLQVSPVSWGRDPGIHKWIGLKYGQRSYELSQRYLASSAQGPEKWDTMILGTPTGWTHFGAGATEAIVDRVKNRGEGLVLCFPFPGGAANTPWPADLKELSALIDSETDWLRDTGWIKIANNGHVNGKKWKVVKDHPITQGLQAALEAMPFEALAVQHYELAPGAEVLVETEDGHPVVAVRQVGKGRVVTFGFRSESLAPMVKKSGNKRSWREYRYQEAFYDLMARATLWSAGREMTRTGDGATATALKHPDPCLTLKQWKNGKGEVTAWELGFTPPKYQTIEVKAPEFIKQGESLKVDFTLPAGLPEGTRITLGLVDYAGNRRRTMLEKTLTVGDTTATLATAGLEQLAIFSEVEAVQDGRRVAYGQTVTYVTPTTAWKDYEVYGWATAGIPYVRDLQMEQLRQLGLTTEQVGPQEARESFQRGFRVQSMMNNTGMHVRNFDEAYREFNRTGDRKLLIRDPSFADPQFLAETKKRQQDWYRQLLPFAPLTVSVGDETSLTSYTAVFDYDMHPENIKKFKARLQAQFGTIEALNAALGEQFAGFDAIEPPLTAEAKKSGRWGLWSLWRDHNDDLWADTFRFFSEIMKELQPEARLSVSGTQTYGVFNGVNWEKLSPSLGAVADYTGRYQLAMRLSFNPTIRSTPWAGYGREGRAAVHQLWTNLTFEGDGSAFFWYPSLLNPDFAFAESAKSYFEALKVLRSGAGMQFQRAQRTFSPVGILWSARSQRAAWMLDKEPEFIQTEKAVYEGLVDAGYDPCFISEAQLIAGEWKNKNLKALVLPMSLSLGMGGKGGLDTVAAIGTFQAAGGTVFKTHAPAYNEYLAAATPAAAFNDSLKPFPQGADAIQTAMEGAQVKPYATIRKADGGRIGSVNYALQSLRDDAGKLTGGKILTVLRTPVGQKEVVGADGVVYMEKDTSGGDPVEKLTIDLGATGAGMQVFDLRSHQAVAVTDGKFTIEMQDGDGRPFALVPYGAVKLNATVERTAEALSVSLALTTPNGQPAQQPHVVRLELKDWATGQVDTLLSRNLWVGTDGKLTYRLPLAKEDSGRRFAVSLQDMLTSGSQTENK